MSENLLAAPEEQESSAEQRPESRTYSVAELRFLFRAQQAITFSILVQILLYIFAIISSSDQQEPLEVIKGKFGLIVLLIGIYTVMNLFLISTKLYSTVTGIILSISSCGSPCIGLLVVSSLHLRVTTILKQHRVRVGFFGADFSTIRDRETESNDIRIV